jgi:hypothetical protein
MHVSCTHHIHHLSREEVRVLKACEGFGCFRDFGCGGQVMEMTTSEPVRVLEGF